MKIESLYRDVRAKTLPRACVKVAMGQRCPDLLAHIGWWEYLSGALAPDDLRRPLQAA